jgi:hypothetical protein
MVQLTAHTDYESSSNTVSVQHLKYYHSAISRIPQFPIRLSLARNRGAGRGAIGIKAMRGRADTNRQLGNKVA